MLSLEKSSGLPIGMKEDFSLEFGAEMCFSDEIIQDFSSLKTFLKDPGAKFEKKTVYTRYHDVGLIKDVPKIKSSGLQCDLTVMPPGKISDEYAKTPGDYHSPKPSTGIRFPTVYEVIYGQVFWVLQLPSKDLDRIEQVYIVEGRRGDKMVVPPGFGQVSVNPANEVLVMSQWHARGDLGESEPYEKHNGAAYYVVESHRLSKNGETQVEPEFISNLNYKQVPTFTKVRPRDLPQYDLLQSLPMYFTVTRNFSTVNFITSPENFLNELLPEKLFK